MLVQLHLYNNMLRIIMALFRLVIRTFYIQRSGYNFSVIGTIKINSKWKKLSEVPFLDSTLCFTLPYLSQLAKHTNITHY